MKKHAAELLMILFISLAVSLLLPNFFKERTTIVIPPVTELLTWFVSLFSFLAVLFFSFKPKEKLLSVPDGFQKLYNENGSLTKEGIFKKGKLITGSKHVYNKDGTFSYVEKYKNGILEG